MFRTNCSVPASKTKKVLFITRFACETFATARSLKTRYNNIFSTFVLIYELQIVSMQNLHLTRFAAGRFPVIVQNLVGCQADQ
jgi:hypothetical protein